ncbi:MAG: hypothetical protein GY827_03575 [Cytophagales bacterium]|nr:hypothetical protein [Cytophagales bacterium]
MRSYSKLSTAIKDKHKVEDFWHYLDSDYSVEKDEYLPTPIPEEIRQLKKLKILFISGQKTDVFPKWFEEFEELEELSISCDFKKIEAFPPNLKKLTIRGEMLSGFLNNLEQLSQLEILSISTGKKFNHLPESIGQLSSLVELNIVSNEKLESLPDTIGTLKKLKSLRLNENQLTSIPDSIGDLEELEILNLEGNRVKELPSTIGNLKKLDDLNLNSNQLTNLPQEIGNSTDLTELKIGNNKLVELPDTIGNLTKLYRFECKNNELKAIPNTVGNWTVIHDLDFSNNQLTELPDSIGNWETLDYFRIEKNKLTKLPNTIGQLKKVVFLEANNNQLTELPDELGNCENLRWISFSSNLLTSFPETFHQLKGIGRFHFKENQLTSFPSFLETQKDLEMIDCSNNQITEIPLSLGELEKIWSINLTENPLKVIPFPLLKLPNLRYFDRVEDEVFNHRKSFLKAIDSLSLENQTELYQIIEQKGLDKLSQYIFFQALGVKYPLLQSNALQYLVSNEKEGLEKQPIKEGSTITVLGKVSLNKTELKQRLKKLGINYATKITEKTSHVVLERGAKNYDNFEKEGLVFISEQGLQKFLEEVDTSHLNQKETDKEEIENVRVLLLNEDFDNVAIGIELVASLGMPKELFNEVFFVANHKYCPTSLRNKAKKLVKLNASEKLLEVMKNNRGYNIISAPTPTRFAYSYNMREYKERLLAFTQETELNLHKIVDYVCKIHINAKKEDFEEFLKRNPKK